MECGDVILLWTVQITLKWLRNCHTCYIFKGEFAWEMDPTIPLSKV